MIVCDDFHFVFIHIPKCAGTSIRDQLRSYDNQEGLFTRVKPHPELGEVDYMHIPLDLLASHFPSAFAKLYSYQSFAVLRDPRARFGSSVREHLRRWKRIYLAELSPEESRTAVLRLLDDLEKRWNRADARYAHFLPQRDFICLGEERIVKHLFPLERIDLLMAAISEIVGRPLNSGAKVNRDYAFRNTALIRPAYRMNSLLWRYAPPALHRGLKRALAPLVTHQESAATKLKVTDMPEVIDFISRHYTEDAKLHRAALAEAAKAPA